jgi:alpha/beta superfamily hydrolase
MSRVERLPPPPAVPVRAPPVAVAGEEAVRIPGLAGGPELDARVHAPLGATRAVVLCHPHPLYGGSMHSPVPLAIAKTLSTPDRPHVGWARFDFRGVGASEGAYDDGRGETDDARAVIEYLRRRLPGAKLSVCGHSFGSWVGLNAAGAAGTAAVERVLLVAPSVRFFGFDARALAYEGPKFIFLGDRDEYCDVGEARALAAKLGARLRIFEGFDHHFMKSRRTMAEAAVEVAAPEA